jgi:hypothetical protein
VIPSNQKSDIKANSFRNVSFSYVNNFLASLLKVSILFMPVAIRSKELSENRKVREYFFRNAG